MRTTVRVDDDLMDELKAFAREQGISVAQLFNRTVRVGLQAVKSGEAQEQSAYVEKTFSMGEPKVDLTKALQLAAALEDEQTTRRLGNAQ